MGGSKMMEEKKSNDRPVKERIFTIKHHARVDFLTWAREQFPELQKYTLSDEEYPDLARRIHQVQGGAEAVLGLTMETSGEAIKRYYATDWTKLREAYYAKDIKKYAGFLESFLQGIEWE
jgi:hypothetical protein